MEILIREWGRVAVLRPKDPNKAIETITEIDAIKDPKQQHERFQNMLNDQPYQFLGFCAKGQPYILSENCKVLGRIQPGDSFVSYEEMQQNCIPERMMN